MKDRNGNEIQIPKFIYDMPNILTGFPVGQLITLYSNKSTPILSEFTHYQNIKN